MKKTTSLTLVVALLAATVLIPSTQAQDAMMEMKIASSSTTAMHVENMSNYRPYSPGAMNQAFRDGKKVILFFNEMDSRGTMLDESLSAYEAWIPSDTLVLWVTYPDNDTMIARYGVTQSDTLVVLSAAGVKHRIDARFTDLPEDIDGFLSWLDAYDITANTSVVVDGKNMYSTKDIVSNVVNASSLTTLVAAVQAAGLVEVLQSDGPFTVFGPNNAAFAKLPAGTVEELVKPENKELLTSILTYHVVAGSYTAADIIAMNGQTITTVQGQDLTIMVEAGKVMLVDSNAGVVTVIAADVLNSNGVVHVIDGVLMP